ncbi:c-type cytochrome [Solimonas terrae]|uniref:Cytochrome c n=1 Tax=Solimonas terrae TaxID=1396819 RepID=A0A6M2BSK0_9GAMM|nr:cytochrome c [Solimonas terrae]NGY05191.1 cytochrome c [Solimonas terrae]
MKRALWITLPAGLVLLTIGVVLWLIPHARQTGDATQPSDATVAADVLARGAALVTLGDCRACHTTRGGAAFAGGRATPTPFGTFYAPNITPDAETGIGRWTADDFWNALHNGRSKDGTLLYPTFPYTNFTKISRADADAMYAYLLRQTPVHRANQPHVLKFPYNHRLLLRAWRLLFFRPGVYEANAAKGTQWNRGAYLVQGVGHCSACHEARNALGAIQSRDNPAGGLVLNWYAPALTARTEAGVQDWPEDDIVALLKTGVSPQGSTTGPMAEVVYESLQHADLADLRAMAVYLKSLPATPPPPAAGFIRVSAYEAVAMQKRGAGLYADHCVQCHGDHGEGRAPAAPALAGNRAVMTIAAINPIRIVLFGGYPPGTDGDPRPFGMPPFAPSFSDQQIADVLTYVRSSWGNDARPVASAEVTQNRAGPLW